MRSSLLFKRNEHLELPCNYMVVNLKFNSFFPYNFEYQLAGRTKTFEESTYGFEGTTLLSLRGGL